MELALRRLLVRSRRRKPRPPWWWFCLAMYGFALTGAVLCIIAGYWPLAGSNACSGAIWWRSLHSPPHYWDGRAFARLWPLAAILLGIGLFTA